MQVIITYIHCFCLSCYFFHFYFHTFPLIFYISHMAHKSSSQSSWVFIIYIVPIFFYSFPHISFIHATITLSPSLKLPQPVSRISPCSTVSYKKWPQCSSLSWHLKMMVTIFKNKGKCGDCHGDISPELILLISSFYFFQLYKLFSNFLDLASPRS